MIRLIIILGLLSGHSAFGQIVNSISGDNSGLYYYSVDTVLKSVNSGRVFERLVLRANVSTIQNFPDTIGGMKVVKFYNDEQSRKKKLVTGDLVFLISELEIIRSQITISINTYEKTPNGLPFVGQGFYKLYYEYLPSTDNYVLTKIKSGVKM